MNVTKIIIKNLYGYLNKEIDFNDDINLFSRYKWFRKNECAKCIKLAFSSFISESLCQ